jgi:hypothetical protein
MTSMGISGCLESDNIILGLSGCYFDDFDGRLGREGIELAARQAMSDGQVSWLSGMTTFHPRDLWPRSASSAARLPADLVMIGLFEPRRLRREKPDHFPRKRDVCVGRLCRPA